MESFFRACAFLALCALAAFAVTDSSFADDSPIYAKAMSCKVTKDTSGTFEEFSLFTEDGSFHASGTGLVTMKGGNRFFPTGKPELASKFPYLVDGDVVSMNLVGTDKAPVYTRFSIKALEDTFVGNTPPLKISVLAGALEMECRTAMSNPYVQEPCEALEMTVHGGALDIQLLSSMTLPISKRVAERYLKKSQAVARGEIPPGCEHVGDDDSGGFVSYDVCYTADSIELGYGEKAWALPLCTENIKRALEREGNASESGLADSKRISDSAASATAPGSSIADGQKAVR